MSAPDGEAPRCRCGAPVNPDDLWALQLGACTACLEDALERTRELDEPQHLDPVQTPGAA